MIEFKQKQDEVTAYLAGIQQGFLNTGIEASAVVEQGAVVDTIISVAQRENADLIAIASHGRSGLSRVFYGSVAAGILQKIDRPLLVIRTRRI
jgi:nucleotide-binding universal stress UspA family protein